MIFNENLLIQCDELIRAGKMTEAAAKLRPLNAARVPRPQRLKAANLCRRVGLIRLGLRILTPLMNFENRKLGPRPSALETAEYAVLLERFGAVEEALQLLLSLDPSPHPEIYLYRAYCHIKKWDYASALPDLREYCARVTGYPYLVGAVNLGAALIATDQPAEAESLLDKTRTVAKENGHLRLQANCLELLSESGIRQGNLARAEIFLAEAASLISQKNIHDGFFVQMWRTYLNDLNRGQTTGLEALRSEAEDLRHFESVREIDLLLLKLKFDPARFEQLVYGTPYASFLRRISGEFPQMRFPAEHIYGSRGGKIIDLENPLGISELHAGGALHRLLICLMKDSYKPIPLGALFAELFPGEHFNIETSPNRVRQLIFRLGKVARESGVPIEIVNDRSGYNLKLSGPVQLRLKWRTLKSVNPDFELQNLKLALIDANLDGFTLKEAAVAANLTTSSVRRMLTLALQNGQVEKFGSSNRTRYYFAA